jgi:hypothetical protein
MKASLTIWLIVASLAVACANAVAGAEIVVSIRYLKAQGASHAQLFLFREDGRLLRQLTNENIAQVTDPRFAPDGETIVFTRELGANKEYWSIEPHGKNLHVLSGAPSWYDKKNDAPFFTNLEESYNGPNPDAPASSYPLITKLGRPIPLPGEPAFLTLTEVRFVAIPNSTKTANRSYMERWDAGFHRIRYGTDAAAICYGASLYRPGMTPAVISVRNFSANE